MAENKDFTLFRHFLGHILIATVLFSVVAAASIVLETVADWIEVHQYSHFISTGLHAVAVIIFVLDLGCLLFFLSVQAYKFVRETWTSRKS